MFQAVHSRKLGGWRVNSGSLHFTTLCLHDFANRLVLLITAHLILQPSKMSTSEESLFRRLAEASLNMTKNQALIQSPEDGSREPQTPIAQCLHHFPSSPSIVVMS